MNSAPLSWAVSETSSITDQRYAELRSLLLRALADMARRGYVVSPDDGLDLIHDFMVNELPGVIRRHDPVRSKLQTYTYRAFVLFSRRRILQLNRWKASLRSFGALDGQSDELAVEPVTNGAEPWFQADLKMVHEALAMLSDLHRNALELYLGAGRRSERWVAMQLGVSRHTVRRSLAEALVRVATLIGERGRIAEVDWNIALARWRDGLSVEDVSARFGIPVSEVQRSGGRAARILMQGLSAQTPVRTTNQSSKRSMAMTAIELLLKTFAARNDQKLLAELTDRREEILAALETTSPEFDDQLARISEGDAEWTGEVYAALCGEAVLTEEDKRALEGLWDMQTADAISVGKSFKNGLVRDLPLELIDWPTWFNAIREIDEDAVEYLRRRADVKAAQPAIEPLLAYGITPMAISAATQAVRIVSDRLTAENKLHQGSLILTANPDTARNYGDAIPLVPLIQEMSAMADFPVSTAEAVFRWTVALAAERPFIFPGFEAMSEMEFIRLRRAGGTLTLEEQWMPQWVTA